MPRFEAACPLDGAPGDDGPAAPYPRGRARPDGAPVRRPWVTVDVRPATLSAREPTRRPSAHNAAALPVKTHAAMPGLVRLHDGASPGKVPSERCALLQFWVAIRTGGYSSLSTLEGLEVEVRQGLLTSVIQFQLLQRSPVTLQHPLGSEPVAAGNVGLHE